MGGVGRQKTENNHNKQKAPFYQLTQAQKESTFDSEPYYILPKITITSTELKKKQQNNRKPPAKSGILVSCGFMDFHEV